MDEAFILKRLGLREIGVGGDVLDGLGAVVLLFAAGMGGKLPRGGAVLLQSRLQIQMCADKRRVVGVAQRVMRDARLLDLKVLHRRGERLLVAVSVRLQIINDLEIDPAGDPVPVEIMDDDVLLQDALVVAAPGEECHVIAAPFAELLQRGGEVCSLCQTLAVKAGELFHFVMHPLEVDGLDVDLELLAGRHVVVQLHGADLNDLASEMNGKFIEYGGFGAHSLVPLQIHHNIMHSYQSFQQVYSIPNEPCIVNKNSAPDIRRHQSEIQQQFMVMMK